MAKKLLIITILLVTSFSLIAQWTCETIDPEFDDAIKIAYTQEKNGAQLMISEYKSILSYDTWTNNSRSVDILWDVLNASGEFGLGGDYEWLKGEGNFRQSLLTGSFPPEIFNILTEAGNIPLILIGNSNSYCADGQSCSVYSFEISLKIGESFKRYKYGTDFIISYLRDGRNGYYKIEWPSKEFWRDFKAANSMKIRIKHNSDSDYQYYEFDMSGSSKAYNYVTADHQVILEEDWVERFVNNYKRKPKDIEMAFYNCVRHYALNLDDEVEYDESDNYCFLHDIDGDNIPELWIVAGSGECCKDLFAYSYEKNTGNVIKEFATSAGHSVIGIGNNYVTLLMTHQNVVGFSKISFDGEELTEKILFKSEFIWDDDSEDYIEHVELDIVEDNLPVESTAPKIASLDDFKEWIELWELWKIEKE